MATFTVRGKNIEITPALKEYVEKRVGKVTKYFDEVGEITVLLTVLKGQHIVEVTVPVPGRRSNDGYVYLYRSRSRKIGAANSQAKDETRPPFPFRRF